MAENSGNFDSNLLGAGDPSFRTSDMFAPLTDPGFLSNQQRSTIASAAASSYQALHSEFSVAPSDPTPPPNSQLRLPPPSGPSNRSFPPLSTVPPDTYQPSTSSFYPDTSVLPNPIPHDPRGFPSGFYTPGPGETAEYFAALSQPPGDDWSRQPRPTTRGVSEYGNARLPQNSLFPTSPSALGSSLPTYHPPPAPPHHPGNYYAPEVPPGAGGLPASFGPDPSAYGSTGGGPTPSSFWYTPAVGLPGLNAYLPSQTAPLQPPYAVPHPLPDGGVNSGSGVPPSPSVGPLFPGSALAGTSSLSLGSVAPQPAMVIPAVVRLNMKIVKETVRDFLKRGPHDFETVLTFLRIRGTKDFREDFIPENPSYFAEDEREGAVCLTINNSQKARDFVWRQRAS